MTNPREAALVRDAIEALRREYARIIARLFTGAPMIWCRRHPAGNCLACCFERLVPTGHPYAGCFEDAAHHGRLVEQLGAYWATALPRPPLVVSYEAIVAHCDLECDDTCLRFHEANRHDGTLSFDQVRRPIYASSLGRAARYGDRLAALHRALES
jgi:hypothetical protein